LKGLEQRSGGSHFLGRDNLLDSLPAKIEDARPGYPLSNDQVMARSVKISEIYERQGRNGNLGPS
jgi:hypothetical protein